MLHTSDVAAMTAGVVVLHTSDVVVMLIGVLHLQPVTWLTSVRLQKM